MTLEDLPRGHPRIDLDHKGRLKIRIKIRRERASPYLTFCDVDRAGPRLDEPAEILYLLSDLVDLRRGAHNETVGFLAYREETGRVEAIQLRGGYSLDVEDDLVDAIVDAGGRA